MLRLSDFVILAKDIIIRVGGVYISVLEHCRKETFRTFLHLTLIGKFFMLSRLSDLGCVVQSLIFGEVASLSKV